MASSAGKTLFLVGPTAVGKTGVAIELALGLRAEILSVDSRQIYRRLCRGTAKPTAQERARVRHHLIDLYEPTERVSAAGFAAEFARARDAVHGRGRAALAVGGSGLYVDACLGRLDRMPPRSPEIRRAHQQICRLEGPAGLHDRLARKDPGSAGRLSPNDTRRVSRALEVFELTGRSIGSFQTRPAAMDLSAGPPMVLLLRERSDLYERIERRAHDMLAGGLLAEIEGLLAAGVPADCPAFESIGYLQFVHVLRGDLTLAAATEDFIRRTRRYAKRQITWFRNRYRGTGVVEIEAGESCAETAERVAALLASATTA
jgi:tRNA dimethylallyltransferase